MARSSPRPLRHIQAALRQIRGACFADDGAPRAELEHDVIAAGERRQQHAIVQRFGDVPLELALPQLAQVVSIVTALLRQRDGAEQGRRHRGTQEHTGKGAHVDAHELLERISARAICRDAADTSRVHELLVVVVANAACAWAAPRIFSSSTGLVVVGAPTAGTSAVETAAQRHNTRARTRAGASASARTRSRSRSGPGGAGSWLRHGLVRQARDTTALLRRVSRGCRDRRGARRGSGVGGLRLRSSVSSEGRRATGVNHFHKPRRPLRVSTSDAQPDEAGFGRWRHGAPE